MRPLDQSQKDEEKNMEVAGLARPREGVGARQTRGQDGTGEGCVRELQEGVEGSVAASGAVLQACVLYHGGEKTTQEGWHSVGIAAKKLRGQACAKVLTGVRRGDDDAANR